MTAQAKAQALDMITSLSMSYELLFCSLTFCIVHRCVSLRVAGGEQTLDSCLSSLDEPALY
jgi:hypothetical protein